MTMTTGDFAHAAGHIVGATGGRPAEADITTIPGDFAHATEDVVKVTGDRPAAASFIPYVQAVGRGQKLRRDLTCAEAAEAMRLILSGAATPAQAGAFLIAQRVKGEAEADIRGFTQAVRDGFMQPIAPRFADLLDMRVP